MPSRIQRFIGALQTLSDRSAAPAPDWTNGTDADPGVTLVELLSFVAEQIGARNDLPAATRAELARVAMRLSELARVEPERAAGSPNDDASAGRLERLRFFHGRVLTAEDFESEQNYTRTRLRRLQRACLSPGIVSGLEVELTGGNTQPAVVVRPGFALDPSGELIEVGGSMTCSLPGPSAGQRFVLLRYVERSTSAMPVPGNAGTEAGRIEEGFAISVEPLPDPAAVLLARLVSRGGRWTLS